MADITMVNVKMQGPLVTLSYNRVVNVPPMDAYRLLIDPLELLKWNPEFIIARVEPEGEIMDGSIMRCSMKNTGKTTILFEHVIPGSCFTHCYAPKMLCLIPIGEVRHHYEVQVLEQGSAIRQTVGYTPQGFGKIFRKAIVNTLRKKLMETFDDFRVYAEQKMQHQHYES